MCKKKIKKEAHPIARSLRGGNFSHINAVAHTLVRMTNISDYLVWLFHQSFNMSFLLIRPSLLIRLQLIKFLMSSLKKYLKKKQKNKKQNKGTPIHCAELVPISNYLGILALHKVRNTAHHTTQDKGH